MTQTVSLSFYRFAGAASRVWALTMMGAARLPLARTPDIGFWKLCGSGTGEGFTPVPNTAVYAILATWPDAATARKRTTEGVFARYIAKATETWTVFLQTQSVRGAWSGQSPFAPTQASGTGALAALTRATIKPHIAARFWARVPNISEVIGQDPNVAFKIGIGEVPMLHQVTFSIWPDEKTMAGFARTGPHAEAIRAVRDEGWFREELYARFAVHSDRGTWNGTSPLAKLEAA
ncbi:spheroidene monooxygenase [Yoonia litorea]|uniref:Spheroidene monooxygenase n=1 Tax=Yoonia litorea TaxID=1123755 RepID=A0A1I6MW91_9RHOB|nr:spheroidene monooxygenase [Yoonia litorea]SFS19871.1 spheroidene monooxygenase [Yoonia litorea]